MSFFSENFQKIYFGDCWGKLIWISEEIFWSGSKTHQREKYPNLFLSSLGTQKKSPPGWRNWAISYRGGEFCYGDFGQTMRSIKKFELGLFAPKDG